MEINEYRLEYLEIIEYAKSCCRVKGESYYENHHIIPKSLGGSDSDYNMVLLTAQEHFKVHTLLPYFTTSKDRDKMLYAWNYMSNINGTDYAEYDRLRKSIRLLQVQNNIGENNPMYGVDRQGAKNPMFGKVHPNKGKKVPQTGNSGSKNGMYNKTHSGEVKQKLKDSQTDRTKIYQNNIQKSVTPDELIYYLIDGWKTGLLYKTETCRHCGLTGKKSQMTRYHHIRCKLNDSFWEMW